MNFNIAGETFTAEPFTDSDIMYILQAVGNLGNIPRETAEKNAAQTLRDIFPALPPDWTKGDRLRPPLHRTTLAVLAEQLQQSLMGMSDYQETLEPLKQLPLDEKSLEAIAVVQNNHRPTQYRTHTRPKKYRDRY